MGLNLVSKSAREIQEGFSEVAIETPDNSVPRTSATRVSPFAMEQAAEAKGPEPETEDHGGYNANSLVCVPERQVTQRAGVSTGGVIYS